MTLQFGSPAGSWIALFLFAGVFGLLGFAITRALRQRSASGAWTARAAGGLMFLAPLWLVYATSIGGFYEARILGPELRLHYLTRSRVNVPLDQLSDVGATPWYKGRWRLVVTDASGERYESATSGREVVTDAAARLRRASQTGAARGEVTDLAATTLLGVLRERLDRVARATAANERLDLPGNLDLAPLVGARRAQLLVALGPSSVNCELTPVLDPRGEAGRIAPCREANDLAYSFYALPTGTLGGGQELLVQFDGTEFCTRAVWVRTQ